MYPRAVAPAFVALMLVACSTSAGGPTAQATGPVAEGGARSPLSASPVATTAAPTGETPLQYTTNHNVDGNRYVAGRGRLDVAEPTDVPLGGTPAWVVGVPTRGGTVWVVALESGALVSVAAPGGEPEQFGELPAGAPPALAISPEGNPTLVRAASRWGAPATHPVLLPDLRVAWVESDGSLHIEGADGEIAVPVDALPDSRILVDDRRLLLVTGATVRYGHGVLGDAIEGGSLTIVDSVSGEIETVISVPAPAVFEGATVIWTDLDRDGVREIIATVSDAGCGARLVVFDEAGNLLARGPAVGRGDRWRHQIAVAPFGPAGELELVDVLTPHIGGVVEFYRLTDGRLEVVAQLSGFRSHTLGSRNLDMGLAADADGDGHVELVVPGQDLRELAGIRRSEAGAAVVWRVPLDGVMATNLGAAVSPDGSISFAVGRTDGVLRIWR